MSKLGVCAGLAGASLAYLGLDAAGLTDYIFSPQAQNTLQGLASLATATGVIGTAGDLSGKLTDEAVGKVSGKAGICAEGAIDSLLASELIGTELFRENVLYPLRIYGSQFEGLLDGTAKVSAIVFTLAFFYTFFAGVGNKIYAGKKKNKK